MCCTPFALLTKMGGLKLLLPLVICLSSFPSLLCKDLQDSVDLRISSHWQDLVRICPRRNYSSCAAADTSRWSSAEHTQLSDVRFAGFGAWSTLRLVTRDALGGRKERGGDAWHVVLRDTHRRIRVSTRVLDGGDGTYLVSACRSF